MGKGPERQITSRPTSARPLSEMGVGGKFQAKLSGWDENRTFPKAMFLKLRYAMAAGS